jgi:hypothetical protein
MGKCLLIFFLYFIVMYASPQDTCIIFTEIMFDAPSGNNEFIELYNRSQTTSINLSHFKIKYSTSKPDTIISAGYSTLLPPQSYAVIFEGDYDFASGIYKNIVPSSALILKISDNAFGSNGMANTANRPLWLINATDDTIDYYTYSANNTSGYSDEKINMSKDTSSVNWGNSIRLNGTPGFKNSLVPKLYDLQISSFKSTPFVISGEKVEMTLKIKNRGTNMSSPYTIKIFNDINKDSIPQPGELILSQTSGSIHSSDSAEILLNTDKYSIGWNCFIALIITIPDEDTSNNIAYTNFNAGVSNNNTNDIIINEIMYAPLDGEPEWIELFNRTNDSLSLMNWTITDIYTTPTTVKISSNISIMPKSYLVISRDSTVFIQHPFIPSPVLKLNIPTLNNDGDGVILKNYTGMVIDSVKYDPQWGGNSGYSLERKSPDISSLLKDNWGNSKDFERSTPGRINSLKEKQYDLSVGDILFNPKFPVAGNDVSVSALIKNNGTSSANNFTVEFYFKEDLSDWKMLSVSNNLSLLPGDSSIIPSSFPISKIQDKYTVLVKVIFSPDQDTLNNYLEKNLEPGAAERSIIVNEIMYDPAVGEPEWIELKNISPETINLKNWLLSDVLTTPTKAVITNQDYFLAPNEFIIAARDTMFCLSHPELSAKTKIVNYGILGNSEDGIIVYDYRSGIIDSVIYNSSWGHKKGYSLERISSDKNSNDSSNWTLSLCSEKSTPGKENSVVGIPDGKRNDLVINEIMYDPAVGNNEFVEFLNLKKEILNIGGWSIEDQHKNKYKLSDSNFVIPPGSYFLLISDSSVIRNYDLFTFNYKTVLNESSLGLTADELILLKDLRGNVNDSVYYSDKWNNKNFISTKGRSLERINPFLSSNDRYNWNTCVDPKGATPGAKNSIYVINTKTNSSISVNPNPFSPDNDGFEDCTIINYSLKIPFSQVNIKIYDSRGRLVRILANNMASGSTGSVIFDGLGNDGLALRIGIYIIFLEALNSITGQNEILKTTVVVARKLH